MRKEITRTVTRSVICCDLCSTEAHGSSDRCFICSRECCYRCIKGLFYARHGDLIEFAIKVCAECQKHALLVEKTQAVLDGANAELRKWVDLWKEAAKKGVEAPKGG